MNPPRRLQRPIQDEHTAESSVREDSDRTAKTVTTPKTLILVIDDSATVRKFAQKCLQEGPYQVTVVASGDEGVAAARNEAPGLVLLDYTLQEGLGTEVCERLSENPELADIPIILMSGKGEQVSDCSHDYPSIVSVLTKPFTKSVLLSAVESALEKVDAAKKAAASLDDIRDRLDSLVTKAAEVADQGPRRIVVEQVKALVTSRLCERVLRAIEATGEQPRDAAVNALVSSVTESSFIAALSSEVHDKYERLRKAEFAASGGVLSLSDVLQALANKSLTGVLEVACDNREIDICVSDGKVCFLNPRRIPLYEVQSLCFRGFRVPKEYVHDHLRTATRNEESIFVRMVEDGVLDHKKGLRVMRALGVEILRSCVDKNKNYRMEYFAKPRIPDAFLDFDLRIPAEQFLLELCTRIDEWELLEPESKDTEAIFAVTGSSLTTSIRDDQLLRVLSAINGRRRIPEISETCRVSTFEVCQSLSRLLRMGMIRVELPTAAGQTV